MLDVISMTHFDGKGIEAILQATDEVRRARHDSEYNDRVFKKKHGRAVERLLEGMSVGTMFVENSTRTNFSSRIAAMQAGATVDGFPTGKHTSLEKGETWCDTAIMFLTYGYDALVMRTTTEGIPQWTKEALTQAHGLLSKQYARAGLPFSYRVPEIVNGGDGMHEHPTQCLLDLRTYADIAKMAGMELRGLPIALLNDIKHSRVLGSTISVAPKLGLELHMAAPPRFGPTESQFAYLNAHKVKYTWHGDNWESAMRSAVVAAHTRPQKKRVAAGEDLRTIKEWGRMDKERFDYLGSDAPALTHPRPVDSVMFEEIHHSLRFDERDWSLFQASNGPYVRTAILAIGLGRMNLEYDFSSRHREENKTTLEELTVRENGAEKSGLRTGHIQRDGIVLDHLPAGMGRRLAGVMGLESEEVEMTYGRNMSVTNGRRPNKDLIKIFGSYELSDKQYEAIALLAPEATINIVREGMVVKKMKPTLGNVVHNRVECGNDACVTNVVIEHVPTRHRVIAGGDNHLLQCDYCERIDSIKAVYAEKRFKYLDREAT